MSKLDDTDLNIIRMLRKDGRTTNKAIAQELGVSEPTIATRIKGLLADKVIRITAQRSIFDDPENAIVAFVELFVDDLHDVGPIVDVIANMDEVIIAYETLRRPELVCHIRASSQTELSRVVKRLGRELPGLSKMRVLPVLEMWRYSPEFGSLSEEPPLIPESDDVNERIIRLLQQDGRQNNRTLAKKLDLSESAVRQRLIKLEEGREVRIGVVCDPVAMNFSVWADMRLVIKPRHLEAASRAMAEMDNLTLVANIGGDSNLALFVLASSFDELDQFVRQKIRQLPGLSDFTLMRVSAIQKHNYNLILMK
ncbi:MAG: Lrp/AsnC family transcriptional regulator [Alphaproteobacteria bacterium]